MKSKTITITEQEKKEQDNKETEVQKTTSSANQKKAKKNTINLTKSSIWFLKLSEEEQNKIKELLVDVFQSPDGSIPPITIFKNNEMVQKLIDSATVDINKKDVLDLKKSINELIERLLNEVLPKFEKFKVKFEKHVLAIINKNKENQALEIKKLMQVLNEKMILLLHKEIIKLQIQIKNKINSEIENQNKLLMAKIDDLSKRVEQLEAKKIKD